MANISLFHPNLPAPAHIGAVEKSKTTKALEGGGAFGKQISIKGGVFRLIDGGKEIAAIEERYLDVVLVNSAEKIGRTFYADVYKEGVNASPTCWSANGERPDKSVASPQHALCVDCPQNQKGSGKDDSRACRFSQRIAVVLANDVEGDVLGMSIPATSLFGKAEGDNRPLQDYVRFIGSCSPAVNVEQVVTRLKFDTTAATPKLFFKPMRYLTDEEYAVVLEKAKTPDATQAVTMSYSGGSAPAAAPAPMAPKQPVALAAPVAPVTPPVDEEPPAPAPNVGKKRGRPAKVVAAPAPEAAPPEPTLRRAAAAPAAAVPASQSLSDIASAWGADDE